MSVKKIFHFKASKNKKIDVFELILQKKSSSKTLEIGEHRKIAEKIVCVQKHENQRRVVFAAQQNPRPKHWIGRLSSHDRKLSFLEKHHRGATRNNRNTKTFLVILNENIGCDAHACEVGKPIIAPLSPFSFPPEIEDTFQLRTTNRCLGFPPGLCSTVLSGRAFLVNSSGLGVS